MFFCAASFSSFVFFLVVIYVLSFFLYFFFAARAPRILQTQTYACTTCFDCMRSLKLSESGRKFPKFFFVQRKSKWDQKLISALWIDKKVIETETLYFREFDCIPIPNCETSSHICKYISISMWMNKQRQQQKNLSRTYTEMIIIFICALSFACCPFVASYFSFSFEVSECDCLLLLYFSARATANNNFLFIVCCASLLLRFFLLLLPYAVLFILPTT